MTTATERHLPPNFQLDGCRIAWSRKPSGADGYQSNCGRFVILVGRYEVALARSAGLPILESRDIYAWFHTVADAALCAEVMK